MNLGILDLESIMTMNFSEIDSKAYIAGVIGGDGHLNKNFIQIDGDSPQWLQTINTLFTTCFNKQGRVYHKKGSRGYRLYISSRSPVHYFHEKWNIPFGKKSKIIEPPRSLTQERELKSFLIGWFDAEAHVEHWKHPRTKRIYLRIQFKTKSESIRNFLLTILQDSGVNASVYKDNEGSFRLQISSRNDITEYKQNFIFLHPKKSELLNS